MPKTGPSLLGAVGRQPAERLLIFGTIGCRQPAERVLVRLCQSGVLSLFRRAVTTWKSDCNRGAERL